MPELYQLQDVFRWDFLGGEGKGNSTLYWIYKYKLVIKVCREE